jgi:hypothetical protein
MHKNQVENFGYYTVVSNIRGEYHYRRDNIGKQVSEKPLALCKIYKPIPSQKNPGMQQLE